MIKNKKIICIITARSGSRGLKDKNIKKLNNKPLMAHTIIAAKKCKYIDCSILSTDSKKYALIGKKFGANVPFLRPKKLATSKAHHPDVVIHAVKFMEKKLNVTFDIVMMLQPTSPFRNHLHLKKSIEKFIKEKNNSLISLKKQDYPPWWLFKLENKKIQNFLNFKNKNVFNMERQEFPKLFRPNGAIYVCNRKLLEKNCIVDQKSCGYMIMDEKSSVDIDNEIDLLVAQNIK